MVFTYILGDTFIAYPHTEQLDTAQPWVILAINRIIIYIDRISH